MPPAPTSIDRGRLPVRKTRPSLRSREGARPLFGCIEGGGTKFVCAVGSGPDDLRAETRIPTTTPDETLGAVLGFLRESQRDHGPLAAIGIACFGPLDPRPGSPSYGRILSTPKAGWSGADVAGPLRKAFGVPTGFDTDVNGAALGEWRWGAGQGLDTFIYMTIGTGIGGGGLVNGKPMRGLLHPEMGHVSVRHDRRLDLFDGICPFHGDCFEGLASGPAIASRWGRPAETLPPDHPAWELEAGYVAQALADLICTLSPQRILVGGGVGGQDHLLRRVQRKTRELLGGYIQSPLINEDIESYIVLPGLGSRSGILGALALGEQALGG